MKKIKISYYCLVRWIIKWCVFKPLYRIQCLLDCGKLHKPSGLTSVRFKWLLHLNYKIGTMMLFYGK